MRRLGILLLWLAAAPALAMADHPGADRLDHVTAEREPAFEATDTFEFPDLDLRTAGGQKFSLDPLGDQIIVLSFVPEGCGAPCAAQQGLLQRVRQNIDATPMRDMVTFVTVGPEQDPQGDIDAASGSAVLPQSGSAADLEGAFAALSDRNAESLLVHVIDRAGRHAAVLHGTGFDPLNVTLYINGLTNAPPPPEPGFVDRILGAFR